MGTPWNQQELNLIVADYFDMLELELRNIPYNKAAHNRALQSHLQDRSKGSIEFKHQNISAVLQQLGKIYIIGYKPLNNFQQDLLGAVVGQLEVRRDIEKAFQHFAEDQTLQKTPPVNYQSWLEDVPSLIANEPIPHGYTRKIRNINWLAKEQINRTIGYAGEELIFNYERWRLESLGKSSLSKKIEWTSQERGDGAGFDIRSYNVDGTDRFIEVKTTKLDKTAPIFFTKNELDFSRENSANYSLCRVFQLTRKPKMFEAKGAIDNACREVEAIGFRGLF